MWNYLRCPPLVNHCSPLHPFRLLTDCAGLDLASHFLQCVTLAVGYIRSFSSKLLGQDPTPTDVADTSRLRQLLSDAEASLQETEEKLKNFQQDLEDLFNPRRFGKDGEWKKLDRLCLEKDTGEYVPLYP